MVFNEVLIDDWPRLFAVAIKDISIDEELLTDYGEGYWDKQNLLRKEDISLKTAVKTATIIGEIVGVNQGIVSLQAALESEGMAETAKGSIDAALGKLRDKKQALMDAYPGSTENVDFDALTVDLEVPSVATVSAGAQGSSEKIKDVTAALTESAMATEVDNTAFLGGVSQAI